MFVAFEKKQEMGVHIDRFYMDGTKRTHVIEQGLLGPISMMYDYELHRIFWADASTGNIESTSIDGDDRHGFRTLQTAPVSLAGLNKDIFWTNLHSKRVFWARKENSGTGNRKITLGKCFTHIIFWFIIFIVDITDDEKLSIVSITPKQIPGHPCQNNNGNCSHLCLLSAKSIICACPLGMNLKSDNQTCFKPKQCDSTQFHCLESDTCIPREYKCDGRKDCFSGEDEMNCPAKLNKCMEDHFQCENGDCIKSSLVCDLHYDCKDKSDETDCSHHVNSKTCPPHHFQCSDGLCIADRFVCDGANDCSDGADEMNCFSSTCLSSQFR